MIEKTEKEIMRYWKEKNADLPLVTIRCTAYNHEKYIDKAIESFLLQITDFPFEIVIHDDASTDRTPDIIRKYEVKYPHIIKPIYEKENQLSKHDGSLGRIMREHTRGMFVAICEGDDYWCDEKKLQKQYDYMINHKECSLCCHNTIFHDINEAVSDRRFNKWAELHKLTDEDVFFGWNVHTSSHFCRIDLLDITKDFRTRFGDYVILTIAKYIGEVVALPDVMSVYNANVPTGATARYYANDKAMRIETIKSRKRYLEKYNEFTNNRFKNIVDLRIAELTLQSSDDKSEMLAASRTLRKSMVYKGIIKKQKNSVKIKTLWKLYGSVFGDIWYKTMILRRRLQGNKKWKQQKS